jgi:hypothetical protein
MKKLFGLSCPEEVRRQDALIINQITETVLPMLPASASATAAKVHVSFLYYATC